MDENKRTKLWAAGLGAVVAIYFLRSTVDGFLMKPIRDLRVKVSDAQRESETLAQQELALKVARRNLDDWTAVSLPPNTDDALRLYREWIFELTRQCGFTGPGFEVVPGTRSPQKEFSTVTIEIRKAEVDLQGLSRFLYLLDQADLMQRVTNLKIDSPGTQGNPRLSVSMIVEGLSVAGTEDRRELLIRTTLTSPLSESATELTAEPNELFPTWTDPFEPFLIRVERELLRVDSVSSAGWKVSRGIEGTKATAHAVSAIVELFPVVWDRKERTLTQYDDLLKNSPFVIPSPPKTWNPRLSGVSDKTIKPGEEVKFAARAESLNPDLGEPQYALVEAAEGMAIDPTSGEFQWAPDAALKPGKYTATVQVTQTGNPELKLESKLTITIKSENAAPQLTVDDSAIVILGREFTVKATATDDGPAEMLKFSVGSGTPEGLTIDAASGEIKWTPARTFTPGKYDVEVIVTDSGEEAKSASKKISLDVRDDDASLTIFSGAFGKDGVLEAWFRNKGTGKTDRLQAGQQLKVSEIDAELVQVTNREVVLRDKAGTWRLDLGNTIRERVLIEATPAAAPPTGDAEKPAEVTPTNPTTDSTPTGVAPGGTAPAPSLPADPGPPEQPVPAPASDPAQPEQPQPEPPKSEQPQP
jgi:hypothetical protein